MKKKQREYKIRGVVQDGGREIRKNGEMRRAIQRGLNYRTSYGPDTSLASLCILILTLKWYKADIITSISKISKLRLQKKE